MKRPSIKSQSIVPRIDGIEKDIQKLKAIRKLPLDEFSEEDHFVKAQFYLRRALEGVFHIGSHILTRIPGGRATEYKEIALKLGDLGVVDKKFAKNSLKNMAGYRNRLTYFYADVTPEEIYRILHKNMDDVSIFLSAIRDLLRHPEKFNLRVE